MLDGEGLGAVCNSVLGGGCILRRTIFAIGRLGFGGRLLSLGRRGLGLLCRWIYAMGGSFGVTGLILRGRGRSS